MRPWLAGIAASGHQAAYVALPKGTAERAMPVYAAAFDADPAGVFGGQSFGGRVASLVAADKPCRGLILMCYPLHRPGHPEAAAERTAHWPRVSCPVLLLSGEADPFARIGLLREAVGQLPQAELVTYPGIGHGLNRVRDHALGVITAWLAALATS
jgi:predicted alpha/beta-hydrolase family hydrolase